MSGSLISPTQIPTSDFSLVVGTTSVIAIPAGAMTSGYIQFMRIYNVSSTTRIWGSRVGPAVVGGAGSFPIGPMNYELWTAPQKIPSNQLQLIAEAAGAAVTIEVG